MYESVLFSRLYSYSSCSWCSCDTCTMLTPCFDIEQNEEFVTVCMRVPYAKLSEAEFFIDGCSFKFYCKPYFLRLYLPGRVLEDGRERAVYDVNKGTVTVHLPKLNHGEYFQNLGMLTALLAKKPAENVLKVISKPLIEVLEGTSSDGASVRNSCDIKVKEEKGKKKEQEVEDEEEEQFDWQVDQQLPVNQDEDEIPVYGFANQHKAVFSRLQHEIPRIVDCPDPDHMAPSERRMARLAHEEASFDPHHYLADLMDNPEITALCEFQPSWTDKLAEWNETLATASKSGASKLSLLEPDKDLIPFTDTEREQLKELPNKEYLTDKSTERSLYLGLADIIFAYAYNHRATEGENNVESAWNISKLSSTLSWLEVFQGSVQEVVFCSIRRSLCYPLFRHWQFSQCVLQDTSNIFHLGRRKLLQCLLSIHQILNSYDPYYVLNILYIQDYCIWIQKASEIQIRKLATELDQVVVDKASIGWELEELEQAAQLVANEDEGEEDEVEEKEEEEEEWEEEEGEEEEGEEQDKEKVEEEVEGTDDGGNKISNLCSSLQSMLTLDCLTEPAQLNGKSNLIEELN